MDDLISRQAAIKKRSPQERLIIAKTLIEGVLDELPSAQTEIILCKDCKQFRDHRCMQADHHVSGRSNCMDVFGAERREE